MLFVGVFGLIVFAFGDVAPAMRPVAELSAALAFAGGAWMLLRQGAHTSGRALETAGGLLFPILLITSLADGFAIPPDLRGGALVAGATLACLVAAVGYAWWARRHPETGLRHAVAPVLWLAAAMAALGAGRAVPQGQDIATPTQWQGAAMATGMVLTTLLARMRPRHPLSAPALQAAVPGVVVVALLTVLTWFRGPETVPVLIAGTMIGLAAAAVGPRVSAAVLDVVLPCWWLATVLTSLGAAGGAPIAAVLGALGYLALIERAMRLGRPAWAHAVAALGLVVCLAMAAGTGPWSLLALAVTAVWAGVRRVGDVHAAPTMSALTVAGQIGLVVSVVAEHGPWWALVTAAALLALVTVIARRESLSGEGAHLFWTLWWRVAVPTAAVMAFAIGSAQMAPHVQWTAAAFLAGAAGLAAIGPVPTRALVPAVIAAGTAAWLVAAQAMGLPPAVRGGMLAMIGVVLMALGRGPLARPSRSANQPHRAGLAWSGGVLGPIALTYSGPGWGLVITLAAIAGAAALLGWSIDREQGERAWRPLVDSGGTASVASWFVAMVCAPAAAIRALMLALPDVGFASPWTVVAVGAALLVGALALDLPSRGWQPRILPGPHSLQAMGLAGGLWLGVAVVSQMNPESEPRGEVVLAAAAAVLGAAVLAKAGAIGACAVVLGWIGVVIMAHDQLRDHPWAAAPVAAVLLGVAELATRAGVDRRWWSRWDVPLAVAAAPVGLTALVHAVDSRQIPVAFCLIGLLSMATGGRLRGRSRLNDPLLWSGTVLALVGTAHASAGWAALALLTLGGIHTVLAARADGPSRLAGQVGGAVAVVLAWLAFCGSLTWQTPAVAAATSLVSGGMALTVAAVARTGRAHRSWPLSWGAVWGGAAVLAASATHAMATSSQGELPASTAPAATEFLVAGGLALTAAAAAYGARPVAVPWLRETAAVLGVWTIASLLAATQASPALSVALLSALAAALAAVSLGLARAESASPWLRASVIAGGALIVLAAPPVLTGGILLAVPVLAAGAAQAAAAGVALRSVAVQSLAPLLVSAAWLVVATQAWHGSALLHSAVPGAAMLVVATMWGRDERTRGRADSPSILLTEALGIALLTGGPLILAVRDSVGYAFVVVLAGVAVSGWGVRTRVRRRLRIGLWVVTVALVALVGVPLARLLPAWGGVALWVGIGALGLLAVLAATFLERGKGMARSIEARLWGAEDPNHDHSDGTGERPDENP